MTATGWAQDGGSHRAACAPALGQVPGVLCTSAPTLQARTCFSPPFWGPRVPWSPHRLTEDSLGPPGREPRASVPARPWPPGVREGKLETAVLPFFPEQKRNFLEMKFTSRKTNHVKADDSVAFNTFASLCTHYLCLVPEDFHHPRRKLVPISTLSRSALPQPQAPSNLISCQFQWPSLLLYPPAPVPQAHPQPRVQPGCPPTLHWPKRDVQIDSMKDRSVGSNLCLWERQAFGLVGHISVPIT